jgi:hypothetical protein
MNLLGSGKLKLGLGSMLNHDSSQSLGMSVTDKLNGI